MVNQKGEFPMNARVSTRVHESTKRLLKSLPYTEAEVIRIGAQYLADEGNLLAWQIGELKLEINEMKAKLHAKEAYLQAKENRLRVIAPKKLDAETLQSMLVESARDMAEEIFDGRGSDSLVALENSTAKQSVMSRGRELGYDPLEFLIEVKNQLEMKCQTEMSDSSSGNCQTEMSDISDDRYNQMSDD